MKNKTIFARQTYNYKFKNYEKIIISNCYGSGRFNC